MEPDIKIKFEKCRAPSDMAVIDYQGNVILCCNDFFSSVVFGNVEKESLTQIWKSPFIKKLGKILGKEYLSWKFVRSVHKGVKWRKYG